MALTGLDIYKLLPKSNCGECGAPTCLAFAMKLAGKKASLEECPKISDEAKSALGEASQPPIKLVTIGIGDRKVELGNETVLFRHEQTFYHQTGIAIEVDASLSEGDIKSRAEKIKGLAFERVGMCLDVNLIALKDTNGNADSFAKAAETASKASGMPLILMSSNPAVIEAALKSVADQKPLVYGAGSENWEAMVNLAKANNCPLALKGKNLEDLAALSEKVRATGFNELILDSGARELNQGLADLTQIRRLALKKLYRPLGYPAMSVASSDDPMTEIMEASVYIAKYAAIVVIKGSETWEALPLVTLRQNIYTDPQKPIQVEPKVYTFGAVNETSPVLITTNFSLTYFTVAGEIEASKIPTYLVIVDTDGTSVLTAWAADKFNAAKINAALKNSGLESSLKHKKAAIPGYVSVISGALEDESGWKVMVGPKEASGIPAFLKTAAGSWAN
ncbi:MAG: acetyl-CoA decarbonylase/synthase complex subunit gamma [Firmicutes bacterium]|nr:acetyl-CoA decarbonylase/synthase complex subunit gamma [Bacillota bacterium]